MLIATAKNIDVVSDADLGQRLKEVPKNEYEDTDEEGDNSDASTQENSDRLYHPSEESASGGSSYSPRHRNRRGIPDILVSWSLDVTPANTWLKFYVMNDAKHIGLSLNPKPVRLRLQRSIGAGSTGCVYEAKVVDNTQEIRPDGLAYAVNKGTSTLVLDYAGEPLSELRWQNLKANERKNIFQAIEEIHELGISHDDLDPRNVQVNFIDVKDSEQSVTRYLYA
ncbi:hypothetical protein ACEPAG_4110 [Sanghuangporus baumii]